MVSCICRKSSQHGNPNNITPEPFAFFYQVPRSGFCISIDCRKYGNEARFVRRSCKPNSEIRHIISGGKLLVYIVATQSISTEEEITIPHEFSSITKSANANYKVLSPPLPCSCGDFETCAGRAFYDVGVASPDSTKKNGLISPSAVLQPE